MRTKYKWINRLFWLAIIVVIAGAIATPFVLDRMNIAPRQLAPYLERRAQGHNAQITDAINAFSQTLKTLDRGAIVPHGQRAWLVGAQPTPVGAMPNPGADIVMVSTPGEFIKAFAQARPGQVITLMPGTYRLSGNLEISQAGQQGAPITVRAERPETVTLELDASEGFLVSAPYWTFENLTIRGVCREQQFCEHAFHIVGKASHFTALNNTVVDFNAHFKINGEDGAFPDDGIIDGNTLTETVARQTDSPVTPIDLVAANNWRISHNVISDFIKAKGDQISYGAFVKGGGSGNRLEQNMVLCEDRLQNFPGQRIGLSLGGGGTGAQYCRDRRCITEQDRGVIQSNVIAACSDDGIYLNRAAASKVLHNTLIDTGAISIRFPESSADVEGNLIDSTVHARDDGLLRVDENMITGTTRLYLGMHPVRDLFADSTTLNLNWKKKPPARDDVDEAVPDLCAANRPKQPSYGAFEDFSACIRH